MCRLSITYKIYLEADDISGSRIQSSAAFVKNLLENHRSPYFKNAGFDNESDIEEMVFRFYIENEIHEDVCTSKEDAKNFVLDMAEILDSIAAANSYMDMEGSFTWEYQDEKKSYTFQSESGLDYCDIIERGGE